MTPWLEQAKAEREKVVADYRARPRSMFDGPITVTEQTPIGRHGEPSRIIYKPAPGVPPEVVNTPVDQPLLFPILGGVIAFLGSYLKLNWR